MGLKARGSPSCAPGLVVPLSSPPSPPHSPPFSPYLWPQNTDLTKVDVPREGPHANQLRLLHAVTGAFRPHVLTALMGASGAGTAVALCGVSTA